MDELISISGTIEEIIYQNADNGYTVFALTTVDADVVTATGYVPYITEGENVILNGVWTTHHDYGEQFKVTYCQSILPTDEDSILMYLSSGIIPGVRAATAKKLVAHFGTDVLDIMLNNPEKLSEIKGISAQSAQKIGDAYKELQSMRGIVMFLQQYNISTNIAVKIHNILGPGAVEMIKANPYILADKVDGISFKTSDIIAFNIGVPRNSEVRIKSGLKYILQNAAYSHGHTYLPKPLLIEHATYILAVDENEIESAISSLILEHEIYNEVINNQDAIYLEQFYIAEYFIARKLCALSVTEQKFTLSEDKAVKRIAEYEKEHNLLLAHEQKNAIISALSSGCMVLTGGPGTGKTTVIRAILELLKSMKLSVALAAPTGRAAKRMAQLTGREAKTIHRLLGTQKGQDGVFHGFSHNESNPLTEDVIIIDEVSMIDINLMAAFLHAIKHGARVIFSGDCDQLPSVGPGNILHDIISSGILPVIKLTKIFRQAQESLITVNAHKINRGELPDISSHLSDFFFLRRTSPEDAVFTITDLFLNRLPSSYNVDALTQIQILSPTKKGITGTQNLNKLLQSQINPPSPDKLEYTYGKITYREGDKIMQVRNNYDMEYSIPDRESGTGIFNGDMGIIKSINTEEKYMEIIFDEEKLVKYPFTFLDEIDLSYAITVHKSQGSEFPIVIMPVCNFNSQLTSRNLFYTAITRAKDRIVLVGSEKVIFNMVNNNRQNDRYSGLYEKLIVMEEFTNSKQRGEFI